MFSVEEMPRDEYTLIFGDETLIVNGNRYPMLQSMSDFQGKNSKTLIVTDEVFFEDMKRLENDYYTYQTSFDYESYELCSMYCKTQTMYDPEYYNIYAEEKTYRNLQGFDELIPILEFPVQPRNEFFDVKVSNSKKRNEIFTESKFYSNKLISKRDFIYYPITGDYEIHDPSYFLPNLFLPYVDYLVCAGGYPISCLFYVDYNDVDIFIHSCDEEKAQEIIDYIASKHKVYINDKTCMFFYNCHKIQIILSIYTSPSQIIHGFDVDCCCILYDLKSQMLYATKRGFYALRNRVNTVNYDRMSKSYPFRLGKYMKRGFPVAVPYENENLVFPRDFEYMNVKDFTPKTNGLLTMLKYVLFDTSKISDYEEEKFELYKQQKIEFKIHNPDEQVSSTFNKLVLENHLTWINNVDISNNLSIPKLSKLLDKLKSYDIYEFRQLIDAENYFSKINDTSEVNFFGIPTKYHAKLKNPTFLMDLVKVYDCKVIGFSVLTFLTGRYIKTSEISIISKIEIPNFELQRFFIKHSLENMGINYGAMEKRLKFDNIENYKDSIIDTFKTIYYGEHIFVDHFTKCLFLIFNMKYERGRKKHYFFPKLTKKEIINRITELYDNTEVINDISTLVKKYYKIQDLILLYIKIKHFIGRIPCFNVISEQEKNNSVFKKSNNKKYLSIYESLKHKNDKNDKNENILIKDGVKIVLSTDGIHCSEKTLYSLQNKVFKNFHVGIPGFRYKNAKNRLDFELDRKYNPHLGPLRDDSNQFYSLLEFISNLNLYSEELVNIVNEILPDENNEIKNYRELMNLKNKIENIYNDQVIVDKYQKTTRNYIIDNISDEIIKMIAEISNDDENLFDRYLKKMLLETAVKYVYSFNIINEMEIFIENLKVMRLHIKIIDLLINMKFIYIENNTFNSDLFSLDENEKEKLFRFYNLEFLIKYDLDDFDDLLEPCDNQREENFSLYYGEDDEDNEHVFEYNSIKEIFQKLNLGYRQKLTKSDIKTITGIQFVSDRKAEILRKLGERLKNYYFVTKHDEIEKNLLKYKIQIKNLFNSRSNVDNIVEDIESFLTSKTGDLYNRSDEDNLDSNEDDKDSSDEDNSNDDDSSSSDDDSSSSDDDGSSSDEDNKNRRRNNSISDEDNVNEPKRRNNVNESKRRNKRSDSRSDEDNKNEPRRKSDSESDED